MGKKLGLSIVVLVVINLFVSTKTSRAENLKDHTGTCSAKVCKDSTLVNELNQLSDRLGIKLDTCCDTRLMSTLADWVGTPYRHAGYSKSGVDCSGFVSKIYRDVYGINLTHSSRSMIYEMDEHIKKDDLKEGDILFFRIHGRRISHVGIYLRNGMFIHASLYRGIVVENLNSAYYHRAYYAAGRITGGDKKITTFK
jgi:cell wall-associated NlpC family hydrolase